MNKNEFLTRLRTALAGIPADEREAAMNYYEEFFNEAGEENEQNVIADLGSPEELAKAIVRENVTELTVPSKTAQDQYSEIKFSTAAPDQNFSAQQNGVRINYTYSQPDFAPDFTGFCPPTAPASEQHSGNAARIALTIIIIILTFPIWIGLLGGALGILAMIYGVFIIASVAFGSGGATLFIGSFFMLPSSPISAILAMGIGLVFLGLIPLVIEPLFKLLIKGTAACAKGVKLLFGKIF